MCVSCIQTAKEKNEKANQIIEQAKTMAKANNRTVGVYTDEYGIEQLAFADIPGLPFTKYISPLMQ